MPRHQLAPPPPAALAADSVTSTAATVSTSRAALPLDSASSAAASPTLGSGNTTTAAAAGVPMSGLRVLAYRALQSWAGVRRSASQNGAGGVQAPGVGAGGAVALSGDAMLYRSSTDSGAASGGGAVVGGAAAGGLRGVALEQHLGVGDGGSYGSLQGLSRPNSGLQVRGRAWSGVWPWGRAGGGSFPRC